MSHQNNSPKTSEHIDTARAATYYRKWTQDTFPSKRVYFLTIGVILLASCIIWGIEARETEHPFDVITAVKIAVLSSASASFLIYLTRWAGKFSSWIIAKQALNLLTSGETERPWQLLAARYRDIHPIVINEAAFQQILITALRRAKDPLADEIQVRSGQRTDRDLLLINSDKFITRNAKAAIIALFICFILIFLIIIVRIYFG